MDNKIQHANANTNETVKIPSNKIFTNSLRLILLGYFNFDRNKHTFEDSLKYLRSLVAIKHQESAGAWPGGILITAILDAFFV